jgi:hypothetical protein
MLCKLPFADFVEKIGVRRIRALADFYRRGVQDCNRPAAFKNATVRDRPLPVVRCSEAAMTALRCIAVVPQSRLDSFSIEQCKLRISVRLPPGPGLTLS